MHLIVFEYLHVHYFFIMFRDFKRLYAASKERQRAYHHTAPISLIFGLYEGVRLALLEGLPARCVIRMNYIYIFFLFFFAFDFVVTSAHAAAIVVLFFFCLFVCLFVCLFIRFTIMMIVIMIILVFVTPHGERFLCRVPSFVAM